MFDGFISYSHAADGLLAPRLQAGLQRFAKPWWRRRALHLFRDEASLPAEILRFTYSLNPCPTILIRSSVADLFLLVP